MEVGKYSLETEPSDRAHYGIYGEGNCIARGKFDAGSCTFCKIRAVLGSDKPPWRKLEIIESIMQDHREA